MTDLSNPPATPNIKGLATYGQSLRSALPVDLALITGCCALRRPTQMEIRIGALDLRAVESLEVSVLENIEAAAYEPPLC